ncbi:capsid protein [Cyclovirus ZM38]|uniref:Capsid protein n=1 Tax=Cyclovirus ZM38 TaxID=1506569 RepID=A0A097ZPH1_9CIRC|nr:capsid protein [Cyclovirus ZM38]
MAPRRRTVRRRAPIRRRRRVIRRRRLRNFRRRPRTGNFTLLVRDTSVHGIKPAEGSTVPIYPRINDFKEAVPYLAYFESYKIHWISVKVSPLFNVAEPSQPVPRYYSTPWHRTPPTIINTNTILSLDRAKSHHGCSSSFRRFVPAVLTTSNVVGEPTAHIGKINWRPKIAFDSTGQSIRHYCGFYHFSVDQVPLPNAALRQYEFEITAKITLYNQKSFA